MRLEDLTASLVSRAIGAYLELAYASPSSSPSGNTSGAASGGGESARAPRRPDLELPADAETAQILSLFQRIESSAECGPACQRYTMRLGNRNYPFMKLLLQEHIVPGQYYFGVDTHDEMEIKPDFPDYEAWMAVKRFNVELKRQIEGRFETIGIPTAGALRDLCAERPDASNEEAALVLVVDDEADLAAAVVSLLRARGFRTVAASDGTEALDVMGRCRPDLVVLDYEMPELDGLEVLTRMRASAELVDVPVLLCTASRISEAEIGKADGFLAKPYPEALLYEMVGRLVGATRPTSDR